MIDTRVIDEIVRRLASAVPVDLGLLQEDAARALRVAASAAIERMSLVSRQELDVQVAVLARTREALERLERRVTELEGLVRERGERAS